MGQGSHLPGTQWTLGSGARHHPTHIRAGRPLAGFLAQETLL